MNVEKITAYTVNSKVLTSHVDAAIELMKSAIGGNDSDEAHRIAKLVIENRERVSEVLDWLSHEILSFAPAPEPLPIEAYLAGAKSE